MKKFVNFKKRDVTLPKGCKDLIDLLRPKVAASGQFPLIPFVERSERPEPHCAVTRHEKGTVELADIGKYIRMALEASGVGRILNVGLATADDRMHVSVERILPMEPSASVNITQGTEEERRVRDFFTRNSLAPPDASAPPSLFYTCAPVDLIWRFSPLPGGADVAAALIKDFFRECAGLENDAPVQFFILEMEMKMTEGGS